MTNSLTHDYMHARYYSSWESRFLSVDPAQADPKNPQSWNRYAYVLGNPLKYTDPFGLIWNEGPQWGGSAAEGQICNAGSYGDPWCAAFTNANIFDSTVSEQVGTFFTMFDAYKNDTGFEFFKAGLLALSVVPTPPTPVHAALADPLIGAIQNHYGVWNGHEGAADAATTLAWSGWFISASNLISTSTQAVAAEVATQNMILAAGGTAEVIHTGFLGSGLSTGPAGALAVGSLLGGIKLGGVVRRNLIPSWANQLYGDTLYTAYRFYGGE